MISHSRNLISVMSLLIFAAGCTVQPLHSTTNAPTAINADVAIEPVDSRLEQQVRNRLIFLLNGGAAEPTNPRFNATLQVKSQSTSLLEVQRSSSESDTTATSLSVTGTLVLADTIDGTDPKTFVRVVRVSYDKTTQLFANSRAEIDAENRAAVELAEELRNLVVAHIKTR